MAAKSASGADNRVAAEHGPRPANSASTKAKIDAARARGSRLPSVPGKQHRQLKRLRSGYRLRQDSRSGIFKNDCGGPEILASPVRFAAHSSCRAGGMTEISPQGLTSIV